MPDHAPTDSELVQRCQSGDIPAAETLYRRHREAVRGLIWRMVRGGPDVEDLVHDVFVRALRGIQGFRGDSGFRTWLMHIATNTTLNFLDRAERAPFAGSLDEPLRQDGETRFGDLLPSGGTQPDEKVIRNEMDSAIHTAINHLPAPYRAALLLRDVEDLTYEEIAGILGISLGTVKSRIARARGQVQAWLRGQV